MGARKNADLARESTNLVGRTSVASFIFVEDAGAEGLFLEVIESLGDLEWSGSGEFLEDLGLNLVFEGVDGLVSCDLGRLVDGGFNTGARNAVGDLEEFVFDEEERGLALCLAAGSGEFFLNFNNGLDGVLGEGEGCFELFFGEFTGAAFDHERFGFGADVNEVEIALGIFVMGGVGDKFSGDASDADGGDRTSPRNIRDHEGGRGAVEGKDIGIILAVGAEEDGDDLGVVVVAFGKEGAQGAIDHSAGKDFFLGGAAFTAEVASGDAADGGGFFFVFDGEGEKVLAIFDFGGGDGGDDDDGFTHGDEGGAVGEFGKFSGFDGEVTVADTGG